MAAQPVDHEAVVYDLVPHVDGRAVPLERELDDLDRAVHPRAEAARRRNQHAKRRKDSGSSTVQAM